MSKKKQESISQLIAEGGTFMMVAGETAGQAFIENGVNYILVTDTVTFSELEEVDLDGNVLNVLGDSTLGRGQRISGIQLPPGKFMRPVTPGGFTKIVLAGTPSTGKIDCVKKMPTVTI